jgi:hypothetical protein
MILLLKQKKDVGILEKTNNMILLVPYFLACVAATFKMAHDIAEATDFTIPFVVCLEKVLIDKRSYEYILLPWRAFM